MAPTGDTLKPGPAGCYLRTSTHPKENEMKEFTLTLTENEVGYIVNVALAALPIKDALVLTQKIVAQATEQANAPANDPAAQG